MIQHIITDHNETFFKDYSKVHGKVKEVLRNIDLTLYGLANQSLEYFKLTLEDEEIYSSG